MIVTAPEEDQALLELANEVAGLLGYAKSALHDLIGVTNVSVLQSKLDQARTALAKARGEI